MVGAVLMLVAIAIAAMGKDDEPRNKVHFYVARDKNKSLWLYLGKPIRVAHMFAKCYGNVLTESYGFQEFGLNENDFDNLKWEDEPVEVFIKMED